MKKILLVLSLAVMLVVIATSCATSPTKGAFVKDETLGQATPVTPEPAKEAAPDQVQPVKVQKAAEHKFKAAVKKEVAKVKEEATIAAAKVEATPVETKTGNGEFPWWIIILLVLIGVIVGVLIMKKKDEGDAKTGNITEPKFGAYTPPKETYTPAPAPKPAEPAPQNPPPPPAPPAAPVQPAQNNVQTKPPEAGQ